MNEEFYENQDTADALMDLFIDQLHHFAELEEEELWYRQTGWTITR